MTDTTNRTRPALVVTPLLCPGCSAPICFRDLRWACEYTCLDNCGYDHYRSYCPVCLSTVTTQWSGVKCSSQSCRWWFCA